MAFLTKVLSTLRQTDDHKKDWLTLVVKHIFASLIDAIVSP
jgi:hypothetical protein